MKTPSQPSISTVTAAGSRPVFRGAHAACRANAQSDGGPPRANERALARAVPSHGEANRAPGNASAFTLLELITSVAVLFLLLATLLPALARSAPGSRSFQCANNLRQLQTAWRLYAADNRDNLVFASDDGSGGSNPNNKYAWNLTHLDFDPNNPANTDINVALTNGPLWSYVGRNAAAFKCPTDESFVVVNGVAKPRTRSFSMNLYFGGFAGTSGGTLLAAFRIFNRTTDLASPGPANTFLFIDQRQDFINWGNFYTDMAGYPNQPGQFRLIDLPTNLHDGAGNLVFADGHTETHRWVDPRTIPALNSAVFTGSSIAVPNDPDVAWLQARATAPR